MAADVGVDAQFQRLHRFEEVRGFGTGGRANTWNEQIALEQRTRARNVGQDLRIDVRVAPDRIELERLRALAEHLLAFEDLEPTCRAALSSDLQRVGRARMRRLEDHSQ